MRNTSRPPGRRRRAASGSQSSGSHQAAAPCSLTTRSAHPSASGTRCASPWTSGKTGPCCRCSRRAVTSCSPDRSTATVRAPARASQAEKYAVPLASSTTSTSAHLAEDAELALGDREQAPDGFGPEPQLLGRRVGEAFVHDGPECAVQGGLVGSAVGHLPTLGRTGVPAGDPSHCRYASRSPWQQRRSCTAQPSARPRPPRSSSSCSSPRSRSWIRPVGCSRRSAGTGCRSSAPAGSTAGLRWSSGCPSCSSRPRFRSTRSLGDAGPSWSPGPRPSAPSRWPPPRPGSSPRCRWSVRTSRSGRRCSSPSPPAAAPAPRASWSVRSSRRRRRWRTGSGRRAERRSGPVVVRSRRRDHARRLRARRGGVRGDRRGAAGRSATRSSVRWSRRRPPRACWARWPGSRCSPAPSRSSSAG